jgi:hypothetical protein
VTERLEAVRPAVRNAILLGIVAAIVYAGFILLVYWRGG